MRLLSFSIFVLFGLWGWKSANSQEVIIFGKDPGYSGVKIHFSIQAHPFIDQTRFSETITCDDSGSFQLAIKADREGIIVLGMGVYEASLYYQAGQSYEVILPRYREIPYAEKISPFYEPLRLPLRVSGSPESTNNRLYQFDSLFYYFNEEVIRSRRSGEKHVADSIIQLIDSSYSDSPNDWFFLQRKYMEGILKLNEGRTGLQEVGQDYLGEIVRETHPAYLELFGAMFKDFLVYYDRTPEGKGLGYHINRTQNLDSLRAIVASHPAVTNDTIRDLILLQELPPLFYRGDFHKESILILLDSLEVDPVKAIYGTYASLLRDKLASLVTGYPPPDFALNGSDGKSWSPADFKGKYTYLMFCTPDHYGCMMEYPYLNSYQSKHSDYLEVVTIMVAEYSEEVDSFMDRNQYLWKALFYGDENGILDDYLVKAFPVAYLLGPDGNIILSPAPLPSDGFEQQLFRIMRSRGDI